MADRSERAVLNHLIETCKDAERGFRHVAEHARFLVADADQRWSVLQPAR